MLVDVCSADGTVKIKRYRYDSDKRGHPDGGRG